MIPASGVQHGTLVSGPLLDAVARAGRGWGGLDLDAFNVLRDTVTTRFTKQLGFRMADIEHVKQKKQDKINHLHLRVIQTKKFVHYVTQKITIVQQLLNIQSGVKVNQFMVHTHYQLMMDM